MNRKTARIVQWWFSALTVVVAASCSGPARVVWQQRYDSDQTDFRSSVAADSDNIIIGRTCRDTSSGSSGTGWELLRYDRQGSLQWQRRYGRGKRDSLLAVTVGADHDIVGVGCTGSASDSVCLRLVKFTARGDLKWDREYALGVVTRGAALRVDSAGRITVCGSVRAGGETSTSDLLLAGLDALGGLLDYDTLDFGADETGQDLAQASSRWTTNGPLVVAGVRAPRPDRPDTFTTRDIVVACLSPDGNVMWRCSYNSGGEDLYARVAAGLDRGIYVAATAQDGTGSETRLLKYGYPYRTCFDAEGESQLLSDTRYPGARNATCMALTADRNGGIVGVGSAGENGNRRWLGWRYFRGRFIDLPPGAEYLPSGMSRADDLAIDAGGNVVVAGAADAGTSIMLARIALPWYKPPPDFPWGVGGGPN